MKMTDHYPCLSHIAISEFKHKGGILVEMVGELAEMSYLCAMNSRDGYRANQVKQSSTHRQVINNLLSIFKFLR